MDSDSFVEIEDPNGQGYEPTEREVEEYAEWLGADLIKDRDLFWIAREALKAPIPKGWKLYQRKDGTGEPFYFNGKTGESLWDHPLDQYFKDKFAEEKRKKAMGLPTSQPGNLTSSVTNIRPLASLGTTKQASQTSGTVVGLKPLGSLSSTPQSSAPISLGPIRTTTDAKQMLFPSNNNNQNSIADVKASNTKELNDLIAQHRQQMEKEKSDYQIRLNDELRLLKGKNDLELENIKAEHRRKIDDLKIQIQRETDDQERTLNQIKTKKADAEVELAQFKQKQQREIVDAELAHNQKLKQLRADHDREIEIEKAKFRARLEEQRRANDDELKKEEEEHKMRLDEMKRRNKSELSDEEMKKQLSKSLQKELDDMKAKHETDKEKLKKQFEGELQQMESFHKKDIDDLKEKFSNEISRQKQDHDVKLKSIQNDFDESFSHESINETLKEELRNQYETEMNKLKDEIETLKKSYKSKTLDSKGSLNEYKDDLETEKEKLREQLEKEIKEIKRKHKEELDEINMSHKNAVEKAKLTVAQSSKLDSMKSQFEQAKEDLDEEHAQEIEEIKRNHKKEIEKLKNKNKKEYETKLTAAQSKQLDNIKNEFESKKEDLQEEFNDEIEEMKKEHQSQKSELVKAFNTELEQLKSKHTKELEKLKKNHQKQISQEKNSLENELELIRTKNKSERLKAEIESHDNSSFAIYAEKRKDRNIHLNMSFPSHFSTEMNRRHSILSSIHRVCADILPSNNFSGSFNNVSNNIQDQLRLLNQLSLLSPQFSNFNSQYSALNPQTFMGNPMSYLSQFSSSNPQISLVSQSRIPGQLISFDEKVIQKMKKQKFKIQKVSDQFSNSYGSLIQTLRQQLEDTTALCESYKKMYVEQSRTIQQMVNDFQQQANIITRNFNNTLNDMEGSYRVSLATISPQAHLIERKTQKQLAGPIRLKRIEAFSDDENEETETEKSIKKWKRESKKTERSSKRVKTQFEHLKALGGGSD